MRLRCWPRRRFARARLLAPGGGGGGGPDLISALPDDLLLLVLARLPCASAAARTAVLSRRWRGLWARLRRLVFREVALPSVEAALGRVPLPPPAVSLLEIRVPDNKRPRRRVPKAHRADAARVNSLLRAGAARRRSPRRLNRRPPPPRPVLLRPRHLRRAFGLNLSSAIRRLPAGVGFSALKTLSLCHPLHCRPQRLALLLLDHLVAAFSVLELHLTTTEGHAFGALVFLLLVLGMNNRIRCAATATPTQTLKVILQRAAMKGGWAPPCLCEFLNWRSQTVSLLALKGFQGEQNGTDFFKLMLKCAPMLKRITVKLPLEASASNDGCVKICNIFKAHSSVGCDVYHSSGLMHNSQNCWRT